MSDLKLQSAYLAAEEKRRKSAILKDTKTMALDFDVVSNPGIYAEDPVWKRFWKTEGIRFLHADGSPVTDPMERFEHAFELGVLYMAKEQLQRNAELRDLVAAIQKDLADQNSQNDLLAIVNRNLSAELVAVKQSLKNYTAAIESL
jgi:hypothetical protein